MEVPVPKNVSEPSIYSVRRAMALALLLNFVTSL